MMSRILIPLLLSLSLGLSTVGFGVARGQAPAVGEMVICTGLGIVTVTVDAEGNPVEAQGLCPDNAAFFHAALMPTAPEAQLLAGGLSWRDWPLAAQAGRTERPGSRRARAPPA